MPIFRGWKKAVTNKTRLEKLPYGSPEVNLLIVGEKGVGKTTLIDEYIGEEVPKYFGWSEGERVESFQGKDIRVII